MSETVVLVPGLGFGGLELTVLAVRLRRRGYQVRVFHHVPWRGSLADKASALARCAEELERTVVHFVGHSMGGIIVLAMFASRAVPTGGRVVLLGSPVNGSMMAERLATRSAGRTLLGRCMRDALEARFDLPPGRDTGVLIGRVHAGLGWLVRLPGPGDGVVRECEALRDEASDTAVLPVTHTTMTLSRRVADAIDRFLRTGRFSDVDVKNSPAANRG